MQQPATPLGAVERSLLILPGTYSLPTCSRIDKICRCGMSHKIKGEGNTVSKGFETAESIQIFVQCQRPIVATSCFQMLYFYTHNLLFVLPQLLHQSESDFVSNIALLLISFTSVEIGYPIHASWIHNIGNARQAWQHRHLHDQDYMFLCLWR